MGQLGLSLRQLVSWQCKSMRSSGRLHKALGSAALVSTVVLIDTLKREIFATAANWSSLLQVDLLISWSLATPTSKESPTSLLMRLTECWIWVSSHRSKRLLNISERIDKHSCGPLLGLERSEDSQKTFAGNRTASSTDLTQLLGKSLFILW